MLIWSTQKFDLFLIRPASFSSSSKHSASKTSCCNNLFEFLINFGTLADTRDSSWDPESLQALFSLLLVSYKAQRGKEIEISYGDIKPIDPIYCHHFHFPLYAIISLHPQNTYLPVMIKIAIIRIIHLSRNSILLL